MNTESLVLLASVVLGFVQLFLASGMVTAQRGPKWNMSSRDEPMPPPKGKAGRADRAFQNFKETFPFFLAAVFLVLHTGKAGTLSEIGAYTYLIARILYVPLYIFDVTGIRSGAFLVSAGGIILVLVQCLV